MKNIILMNEFLTKIKYTHKHLANVDGFKTIDSKASYVLLLGTAMVESGLIYRRQIGGGGALSPFQIEKATYKDNIDSFLSYEPNLYEAVIQLMAEYPVGHAQLFSNDCLAIAHARIKYWRVPKGLPEWDDAEGIAKYHKEHYNTPKGKTDINESEKLFEQAIEFIGV